MHAFFSVPVQVKVSLRSRTSAVLAVCTLQVEISLIVLRQVVFAYAGMLLLRRGDSPESCVKLKDVHCKGLQFPKTPFVFVGCLSAAKGPWWTSFSRRHCTRGIFC